MKQVCKLLRLSKNGYEVAGLEQPIDISDDEKLGHVFDMYIVDTDHDSGGDDDDSVEATLCPSP